MAAGALGPALDGHEEATRFFERAAALGHATATYQLALAYNFGEGVEKDPVRGRELIGMAAARGHADSQYLYGNYYARGDGEGFPKDDAKAAYWYECAAKQGHTGGIYRLGVQFMYGRGVKRDFQRGWDLTEKAAELGNADAMLMMGAMIETGETDVKDPAAALDWYGKAADKGNAEAQYRLGERLVRSGKSAHGKPFLEQAALQGHQEAEALLDTVTRSEAAQAARIQEEGAKWSKDPKSMAIAGDANAQFQLGFAHFSGVGAARSLPLSYFWLKVVERSMPMAVGQMLQAVGGQLGDRREELDGLAAAWAPGTAPPEG